MSRICLYYICEPEGDRWLPGDRYIRPLIRRLVRGKQRPSGVDKVFINLCLGLDKLGINYEVNLPFKKLQKEDRVGILGRGRFCLKDYHQSNPIVAGVALMNHPNEWPNLCQEYPVTNYLQHSNWANEVYKPYFHKRCTIWPVGIDTYYWKPTSIETKSIDFLIYNKIRWNYQEYEAQLLTPIRELLNKKKLSFEELRYGHYTPKDYQKALNRCRAMIFLCEHESQGIAYQECLASGVPILAWDQQQCLDPNRFNWGTAYISATSVPYWDERCGVKFRDIQEFPSKLAEFLDRLNTQLFAPRDYINDNLTLEKCARHYLEILNQAQEDYINL